MGRLQVDGLGRNGRKHPFGTHHADERLPIGLQFHEGPASGRELVAVTGHPHHVHPDVGTALGQVRDPGQVDGGLVHQHDHGGHHRGGRVFTGFQRAPQRWLVTFGAQVDEVLELVQQRPAAWPVACQAGSFDRPVRRRGVRQPFEPAPGRFVVGGGEARQHHFGGRVQRSHLEDQAASDLDQIRTAARDPQTTHRPQIGDDRRLVNQPVLLAKLGLLPLQRHESATLRCLELVQGPDRTDTQPHLQELGMFGLPAPQRPVPVHRRIHALGGGGIQPAQLPEFQLLGLGHVVFRQFHALMEIGQVRFLFTLVLDPGGKVGAHHQDGAHGDEQQGHGGLREEIHRHPHHERGDERQQRESCAGRGFGNVR